MLGQEPRDEPTNTLVNRHACSPIKQVLGLRGAGVGKRHISRLVRAPYDSGFAAKRILDQANEVYHLDATTPAGQRLAQVSGLRRLPGIYIDLKLVAWGRPRPDALRHVISQYFPISSPTFYLLLYFCRRL